MGIEIRTIGDEEIAAFVGTSAAAFLEHVDATKLADEMRPFWDLSRAWAAFDDGRVCGTFRSWATELTVPGGGRLPAAAVVQVTVLPTHRRRGILRQLIAAEHGAIRERGEAVGLLHAAEYPIYGRFGYGPATQEAEWSLATDEMAFNMTPSGRVDIVPVDIDTRDAFRDVFETSRLQVAGAIRRREWTWDYELGLVKSAWGDDWKGFAALHRDGAGVTDGYVRYHVVDDKWERRQPRNVLKVDELVALTDDAYIGLWQFLASIDWVGTIKAERRTPTERLPWFLVNARAAVVSEVGDDLWVRLFDVARALETRSYEGTADIVLEVIDAEAQGGRSRLQLEATPDGARCRTTRRAPDLTLDVAALGAAYLGGTRLADAVLATGVDEHRAGSLADLSRVLSTTTEPRCTTFF